MTGYDHPNVRKSNVCPRCQGVKGEHLLLCWPCHHLEKNRDHDMYSVATEALIERADNDLSLVRCVQ